MSKILAMTIASLLGASPALASDSVYGIWSRDGHDEKMEFFDCGGALCAHGIIPMPDGSPQPLVLRHAKKIADNQWKGELFNPEDGKVYSGEIHYKAPSKLTLTGCMMSVLCQSETWTKISGPVLSDHGKASADHAKAATDPAASPTPAKKH